MTKEKTTEFIEKAIKIHGLKYDYSKVVFGKNNHEKVEIICPIHGSFFQSPKNHLNNHGCPKCSKLKIQERCAKEFKNKAQSIHGNKYDYSKVRYIDYTTKVCIICPEHGEFWQSPKNHLLGKGCRKCGNERMKIGTDNFIKKAKIIHGEKYDYSKVEYVRADKKVCIICPVHGEFYQRASIHLEGHGCPMCTKGNTRDFILESNKIHGEKYDYSKVEYVNNKTKVAIICPNHGEFLQTPKDHILKKYGCPNCHPPYSKAEKEIVNFIKEIYSGEIKENVRDLISPKEVDIYLPSLNLAFEYNGLFYHSSNFNVSPTCSRDKFLSCEKKNVQLITIYEDEWEYKKEVVKSMISHFLGEFERIFARKTVVKKIEKSQEYQNFLEENHIQGRCPVNFAYGLYYNGELVSVMTFTLPRKNMGRSKEKDYGKIELSRFCNKKGVSVIGGASKLLKRFIESEDGLKFSEVYSYSDNRISQGNLYKAIGFELEKEVPVNYFYTNFKERRRKQGFRKSKFKDKGINIEGKTEEELAREEGWHKIYDCGKRLWVLKTNKNELD